MLRANTVFVVGAGASQEAGMPFGREFSNAVAKLIDIKYGDGITRSSGDAQVELAFRRLSKSRDEPTINPLLRKAWQIVAGLPHAASIDNYIHNHSHDIDIPWIGKLGIARAILIAESSTTLHFRDGRVDIAPVSNTFYGHLLRLLSTERPFDDLDHIFDNATFVSFNYDRTLEHYLAHAIQTAYGLDAQRAQRLVGTATFFHPYGRVGRLPWMPGIDTAAEFGSERIDLESVANQLKTFTESTDAAETKALRQAVASADRIVFLGFSFWPQNIRLLFDNPSAKRPDVILTRKGISQPDLEAVLSDLQERAGDFARVREINGTCSDLFNEYSRLLSRPPL